VLASGLTAIVGLAGLAGCTGRRGLGPSIAPSPTPPPPPDPLLAELADERRLLAAYDATGAAHPTLAARTAPLRADHAEHEAALAQAVDAAGSTPPAPTGSPVPPIQVPGPSTAVLATLRAAERAAAAARTAAALTAPGDRAGLLASIAASEATHEVMLR